MTNLDSVLSQLRRERDRLNHAISALEEISSNAVSPLAQFRWPVVSQDRPFVLAASQTIRHKYCGFAREVKRSEVWIAHSGTP